MIKKFNRWACYIGILLLLPYLITLYMNGKSLPTSGETREFMITVQEGDVETTIGFDEYCIRKLAGEIGSEYELEAIKAQAVIVRTTVLNKWNQSEGNKIIVEDGALTEPAATISTIYKKAWEDTKGMVMVYNGQLIHAPFCRLTNGNTRDGKEALGTEDYPYLKIRGCPLDVESKEQLQTLVLEDLDATVSGTDSVGYVTSVRVGTEEINGEEFRKNYGLYSSCFTLQRYEGKLRITTRGVGHGLGLSQYSANEMAKEGKKAEEILQYFFDGIEIKEVTDVVRNVE